MAEQLHPDQDQQEQRASTAKGLAETITRELEKKSVDADVTFKGETIDVNTGGSQIVVTANSDGSFSIKDGPGHASEDQVLKFVLESVSS